MALIDQIDRFMALQYFGDPGLAAKLTYAGTSGLGEGIGSGLAAFGRGIGRRRLRNEENEKELKREGQESDALEKLIALRGYASKDEAKMLSLGEKRGLVQAKEMESVEAMRAAQMRAYAASAAENEAQAANISKARQFWQAIGAYSGAQIPQAPPGPFAPEVLDSFEALAANYTGQVGLPQLSSAMALSGYQPTAADMALLGKMAEGREAIPPIGFTVPVTAGGKKGDIVFKGTKEGQFVAKDEEKRLLSPTQFPFVRAKTDVAFREGLGEALKRLKLSVDDEEEFTRRAGNTWRHLGGSALPPVFGFTDTGDSPQPPAAGLSQQPAKKGTEQLNVRPPAVRKLQWDENGRLIEVR